MDSMAYITGLERLLPGLGPVLALNKLIRKINAISKADVIGYPDFEGTGLFSMISNRSIPTVVRMLTGI